LAVFYVLLLTKRLKYGILIPLPEKGVFIMNNFFHNKKSVVSKFLVVFVTVLMVCFGSQVIKTKDALAFSFDSLLPANLSGLELYLSQQVLQNENSDFGQLPVSTDVEPLRTYYKIPTTAYSSEVGQTDSTPFITASGTSVRHGVIAANFLPIGTRVRLPDLYGDEVFVVEDRMNARYNQRVDIWMEETADARNFGIHWTTVEVF
jgi:3D (Asp-Asp-Asp) domain-containing protein